MRGFAQHLYTSINFSDLSELKFNLPPFWGQAWRPTLVQVPGPGSVTLCMFAIRWKNLCINHFNIKYPGCPYYKIPPTLN